MCENESKPTDFLCVDRSKTVALRRRPFIAKRLYILASPVLCFNHRAHHQPREPKQILKLLSLPSQIHTSVPVATQQARLARWWKDQACRWTDRISRGAWLCENWASLRLTLIVEGSPLHRIFSARFLTWATIVKMCPKCQINRYTNKMWDVMQSKLIIWEWFGEISAMQSFYSQCLHTKP